jgi:hypothetical protein
MAVTTSDPLKSYTQAQIDAAARQIISTNPAYKNYNTAGLVAAARSKPSLMTQQNEPLHNKRLLPRLLQTRLLQIKLPLKRPRPQQKNNAWKKWPHKVVVKPKPHWLHKKHNKREIVQPQQKKQQQKKPQQKKPLLHQCRQS